MQVAFPERTLTAEQQAVVELVNRLLAAYPDHQDSDEVRRLAAYLLEIADVAPQQDIAEALGYESARTIRHIRDQVEQEGLDALLSKVMGRASVTTRPEVVEATLEEILNAVINEHELPEDEELARRINERLGQTDYDGEPVTARMVQTIRLRKDIKRVATKQALSSTPKQDKKKDNTSSNEFSLGHTRWGGAFVLLALLVRGAWLEAAHLLTIASDYAVTPEQLLLTAIFSTICGISRTVVFYSTLRLSLGRCARYRVRFAVCCSTLQR